MGPSRLSLGNYQYDPATAVVADARDNQRRGMVMAADE